MEGQPQVFNSQLVFYHHHIQYFRSLGIMAQIEDGFLRVSPTIGYQVTGSIRRASHIMKDGSHPQILPIQLEPLGFSAQISSICIAATKQHMVPAAAHKIAAYPFIMAHIPSAIQKYPIGLYTLFSYIIAY